MTSNYDWSKFFIRININSSVEEIYAALCKPARLEKWLMQNPRFTNPDDVAREPDSFIEKDDAYEWCWDGPNNDNTVKGKVIEANGRDLLQFTFLEDSIVTIIIKQEAGEMVTEMWQENIPTSDASKAETHVACIRGWTFYLTNLKAFLETGLDLRNKNEKLINLANSFGFKLHDA